MALARDLGLHFQLEIFTDASAAIGICKRKKVSEKSAICTHLIYGFRIACDPATSKSRKVLGTMNPADVLTKHVDRKTLERHLLAMGVIEDLGRAASAPTIEDADQEKIVASCLIMAART